MTAFIPAFDQNGDLVAPPVEIPELCRKSCVQLAGMIRSGEVSSVELVGAFLDHIETSNPTYNAIVSIRPREELLAEARVSDDARRSGAAGALHGLPIAIKDMQPTKGLRTTFGSPLFADFVPEEDSLTVARIRAAGAILIGKTNTPEFALGSHTYNPVFGRTCNAFDPAVSAGGSSGGAAVALALRMLPIVDGSDFGGSLRNPAAFNNVFGLRPSLGRVPNVPSKDGFFSQISTDGPMARTVGDLALMLGVMSGYDPRAPLALGGSFDGSSVTPSSAARVAWLGDLSGHIPTQSGILGICENALAALVKEGWQAEAVVPEFDFAALWRAFLVLRQFSALGTYRTYRAQPASWERLKPELQWEIEQGSRLSAEDVSVAAAIRSQWRDTALNLLQTYDVLAMPSAQVFPFPMEWDWPKEVAGRQMTTYHQWVEVAAPASLTGFPVVNVPVGFNENGHPMGMQLIGRPQGETELLSIAASYESLAPRTI